MSDAPTTPQSPPPADPPPVPRRLTRSSSDKVLAGVAGGLGRYFDIDPIIFRIGFVVLTLAGGAGVLAYLAAWVLVPDDPIPGQEPADRSRAATIAGAAVLALAAVVLLGPWLVLPRPAADRPRADRDRRRGCCGARPAASTAAPRPPRSGSPCC
jgi:phage shock protein PspC (stress-responsive transcriptional regulator)